MLHRRLTLLQAVSLNMAMMVGIGPFITIPTFVGAMGGPQALVGWVLGAMVALADGLVWSELAAAFPGSGGTFHFYDAVYGESALGRMMKFLFVWQFLFSGPLEVATGAIGLAQYVGYLWPALKRTAWEQAAPLGSFGPAVWRVENGQLFAAAAMAAITLLAYRRIEAAGKLMVVLWCGMLATVACVIVAGLTRFDPALAFTAPPNAWRLDAKFASGLGLALGIAMYDFLGYYQICYLGDEVADAPRTIPRSILISVATIAVLYLTMNLGILGVLPWREVAASKHVASDMMQRLFGGPAAAVMTGMIVWTAAASTFAALLGYSRVPYAAAVSGHFFKALGKTHPTGEFPHRSLLLIAGLAAVACLAELGTVIEALLTSRILVQFVGQIATVVHVRRTPELAARLRFRMWLYPLPALVALAGWLYAFVSTNMHTLAYGLTTLALGGAAFACREVWSRREA
jgi:amino acid transporter